MGESYSKRCVYCGKWIQMREMPHGQWVPFEDYDTVHNCDKQFAEFQTEGSSLRKRPYPKQTYYRRDQKNSEESGCSWILWVGLIIFIVFILSR